MNRLRSRRSLARALFVLCCAAIVSAPTGSGPTAPDTARFEWFEYRGNDGLPQPRPGEYRNPILQGFYPDPSITRVGNDFYLVTSTFAWFPGLPIFHSRNLVNWTQIGNAIDRPEQVDFKELEISRGLFAPAIEHHRGTFYIVNTCVDCGGNFVITAKDPRGPWSDPVWLEDLKWGIDPSLFFEDNGRAWILNNDEPPGKPLYEGHRAIWIQEFDPTTMKTFGRRTMLVNGGVDISQRPIWIEGPHIFKKDGWYYLTAAEGGTAEGHSQVVLRSRSVTGPYEPFAENPILTQRDLPRGRASPITSAGHADLVQTPAGEWWATFLAVRPYADDFYNTGRETFLMPVRWENGWPRITNPKQPIPWTAPRPQLPKQPPPAVPTNGAFVVLDEFDGTDIPLHWMMMRNPRDIWWRLSGGALHLAPRPTSLGDSGNPSLLARRQQHMNATATTSVRFTPRPPGSEAGIAAIQNNDFWYLLSVGQRGRKPIVRVKVRSGAKSPRDGHIIKEVALPTRPGDAVGLRITANGGQYDFAWSADGHHWRTLVKDADGTFVSTKRAGGFVGTMLGLYAYEPQVEVK